MYNYLTTGVRHLAWIAIPVGLSGACSRSQAPANTSIPATVLDSSQRPNSNVLAIYAPGLLNYQLEQHSIVQGRSPRDSTSLESDTVNLTAQVSLVLAMSPSHLVSVQVHADSIRSQKTGGTTISVQSSPPINYLLDPFTGRIDSVPTSLKQDDCRAELSQVVVSGRELLPVISPSHPTYWTDTTSYSVCRSGILLNIIQVARYSAGQNPDVNTRKLFRMTDLIISGTGIQWGQPISVTGTAITSDTLDFSAQPNERLQQVRATAQLHITFKSALRSQDFIQTVQSFFEFQRPGPGSQ